MPHGNTHYSSPRQVSFITTNTSGSKIWAKNKEVFMQQASIQLQLLQIPKSIEKRVVTELAIFRNACWSIADKLYLTDITDFSVTGLLAFQIFTISVHLLSTETNIMLNGALSKFTFVYIWVSFYLMLHYYPLYNFTHLFKHIYSNVEAHTPQNVPSWNI